MVRDSAAENETFRGRSPGGQGDEGCCERGRRRRRPYRSPRLLAVWPSCRLAVWPSPSLPTALNVAHAPDGAHGVETRRLVVRVEADVLVRVPEMGFAGEEIFDLEWFPGV
jgi:hypothetical protein